MKIVKKSVLLELPETLEEGNAKIMCDKPYIIQRNESNNEITWYGYNTNWNKKNNQWYMLIGSDFVPCDIPEYEKMYLKLI